jgi:hypothetical protein
MATGAAMAERTGGGQRDAADLNLAEQFVLWALRTRLEGRSELSRLEEGFRLAHDQAAGGAALEAFEPWFVVLATGCWRDLYLHRSSCPCLSGDERAMLDLIASAQVADEQRLRRIAAALVHPRARESLLAASRRFAQALERLGLRLWARPAPRAAAAWLH